jgi:MFS family permease
MANRWIALAIVFVTRTSMGFQFQAVASVAPLMVADLGLSYAQLGTLVGIYMLPGAFFALPGGVIGQRFGERRVVVAGLALMVIGGVLTASANSFGVAATGRVVSGIGAVLMNILLARLTSDWFAGKELSTAMSVMLTSWPVGLGLATAMLAHTAARSGWRWAIVLTVVGAAIGLLLMLLAFREAPRGASAPTATPHASLAGRARWLSVSAGFAWGCFNASLVAIIVFGPGLLIAGGTPLGEAGSIVSLAIWLTILSIPLGGLLGDRLGRPNVMIVVGCLVAALFTWLIPVFPPILAFCLVGFAIGPPPGPLMALLPRALPPERLTTGFGIFYAFFYAMMAVTQPAAGLVRDRFGTPGAPIKFAAIVMALTVVGLVIFRSQERVSG